MSKNKSIEQLGSMYISPPGAEFMQSAIEEFYMIPDCEYFQPVLDSRLVREGKATNTAPSMKGLLSIVDVIQVKERWGQDDSGEKVFPGLIMVNLASGFETKLPVSEYEASSTRGLYSTFYEIFLLSSDCIVGSIERVERFDISTDGKTEDPKHDFLVGMPLGAHLELLESSYRTSYCTDDDVASLTSEINKFTETASIFHSQIGA